jgi:NAD dependent epimerase/dehydratase family enzyme
VSPSPLNNADFTKEFAVKLNRPAKFHVPEFLIRILYGEGSSTVLEGQKAVPSRLLGSGFRFKGNNLNECLNILEK